MLINLIRNLVIHWTHISSGIKLWLSIDNQKLILRYLASRNFLAYMLELLLLSQYS
jgi:hypothetical protein